MGGVDLRHGPSVEASRSRPPRAHGEHFHGAVQAKHFLGLRPVSFCRGDPGTFIALLLVWARLSPTAPPRMPDDK